VSPQRVVTTTDQNALLPLLELGSATQQFLSTTLVQQLESVGVDQLYVIDGSRTVGAAWARICTLLGELEEILLEGILLDEEPRLDRVRAWLRPGRR
jgi:hypothetical protein